MHSISIYLSIYIYQAEIISVLQITFKAAGNFADICMEVDFSTDNNVTVGSVSGYVHTEHWTEVVDIMYMFEFAVCDSIWEGTQYTILILFSIAVQFCAGTNCLYEIVYMLQII